MKYELTQELNLVGLHDYINFESYEFLIIIHIVIKKVLCSKICDFPIQQMI